MFNKKLKLFSPLATFVFLLILIFVVFRELFFSYFEADEWFHFTHYLPLTHNPYGFLIAPIKSVTDAIALSQGQHVVPIGEELFFLSTKLFGMNFALYAFMSLLLHATNSSLVWLFIRELLGDAKFGRTRRNIFASIGGIFFALSAIGMPAVTWAAFYGQNVLSVTFFLLCLVFLQKALNTKRKLLLFFSALFFMSDLLTKETSIVLAGIIPFMFLLEKKIFSWKFIAKIYLLPFILFLPFRFLLPKIYLLFHKVVVIPQLQVPTAPTDMGVVLYRLFNFPLNMVAEVYFPRETILWLMKIITPILYLQFANEPASRAQNRLFFLYGPGNEFLVYLFAIIIIVMVFLLIKNFYRAKKKAEAHALLTGSFIILVCSLPLVVNVLYLPAWGTDFFDSRHYYMPTVGAAILFPFLLFSIAGFIARFLRPLIRITLPTSFLVTLLFVGWLINNNIVLQEKMKDTVKILGYPRREIVRQLQELMPVLPQKVVIYFETDGGGPFGPVLPFQTSIPQVLSVVYFDKNSLPDSFYNNYILDTKAEGYQEDKGRGFGYYATKKTLADGLLEKKFSLNEVRAFYYDSKAITVTEKTTSVRKEMQKYLTERKKMGEWKTFNDASSAAKLQFSYPPEMVVSDEPIATTEANILKSLHLIHPDLDVSLKIMKVTPTFDPAEMTAVQERIANVSQVSSLSTPKVVSFDRYHTNTFFVSESFGYTSYLLKLDDLLLSATTTTNVASRSLLEQILGSVILSK